MPAPDHVPTYPAEAASPEVVPDAIHVEPGGSTQSDDINVTIVVLSVVFCVVFLVALIASLQAWFYNETAAAVEAKAGPNPRLLALKQSWNEQLTGTPTWADSNHTSVKLPIDQAIDLVIPSLQKPVIQTTPPEGENK